MRSVCIALALLTGIVAHAQNGQHPVITSHDVVDGPGGGEHKVEDLRISKDGSISYTIQEGPTKSARKTFRSTISTDKLRSLVQLLSRSEILVLPRNLPAQTYPTDFFWDMSMEIDRPEGTQSVHIDNFYPFLNLNGLVYPQALIELECSLQEIKSITAKRSKGKDHWCEELLSHNASATESYECSQDEAQTRIVGGGGWGVVRVGADLGAVGAALGEGQPSRKFSDVYFLEYRRRGIEISVNTSDHRVHAIFFYNHQQGSEQFGVFCGQTDKGVNWRSRIDDVKNLYGEPTGSFLDGNSGRLAFPGIDFRFESGRLVRIGVPGR